MDLEIEERRQIGFYTATIWEWKKLLYKVIIVSSLRFIVEAKRVKVYGF